MRCVLSECSSGGTAVAEIFISYKRKSDEACRDRVIQILQRAGRSVWTDEQVLPGERYEDMIMRQAHSSRAVIVIWSRASIGSDWVKHEASVGSHNRCLVPISVDGSLPEGPLSSIQALHLVDGAFDPATEAQLVAAVRNAIGVSLQRARSGRGFETAPGPADHANGPSRTVHARLATTDDASGTSTRPRRALYLASAAMTAAALITIVLLSSQRGDHAEGPSGGTMDTTVADAAPTEHELTAQEFDALIARALNAFDSSDDLTRAQELYSDLEERASFEGIEQARLAAIRDAMTWYWQPHGSYGQFMALYEEGTSAATNWDVERVDQCLDEMRNIKKAAIEITSLEKQSKSLHDRLEDAARLSGLLDHAETVEDLADTVASAEKLVAMTGFPLGLPIRTSLADARDRKTEISKQINADTEAVAGVRVQGPDDVAKLLETFEQAVTTLCKRRRGGPTLADLKPMISAIEGLDLRPANRNTGTLVAMRRLEDCSDDMDNRATKLDSEAMQNLARTLDAKATELASVIDSGYRQMVDEDAAIAYLSALSQHFHEHLHCVASTQLTELACFLIGKVRPGATASRCESLLSELRTVKAADLPHPAQIELTLLTEGLTPAGILEARLRDAEALRVQSRSREALSAFARVYDDSKDARQRMVCLEGYADCFQDMIAPDETDTDRRRRAADAYLEVITVGLAIGDPDVRTIIEAAIRALATLSPRWDELSLSNIAQRTESLLRTDEPLHTLWADSLAAAEATQAPP